MSEVILDRQHAPDLALAAKARARTRARRATPVTQDGPCVSNCQRPALARLAAAVPGTSAAIHWTVSLSAEGSGNAPASLRIIRQPDAIGIFLSPLMEMTLANLCP